MERVRLLPPVPDVQLVQTTRKAEARKYKGKRQSGNACASIVDDGVCHCDGEASPSKTSTSPSKTSPRTTKEMKLGCPISMSDFNPDIGRGFTTRQTMATEACYIPMVQHDYQCDEVHVLALWGIDRESDLIEYIKSVPGSIDTIDSAGNTVLMLACVARHPSYTAVCIILEMLSQEAVNAHNNDGLTALHFAVLNNQREIVEHLLDHKADVNAGRVEVEGRYYGLTPVLMSVIACVEDNVNRCLDVLLRHNPDLRVETVVAYGSSHANLCFLRECDCGGCSSYQLVSVYKVLPPSKLNQWRWRVKGDAAVHATKNDRSQSLGMLLNKFEEMSQLDAVLKEPTGSASLTLFGVAADRHCFNAMDVLLHKDISVVNQASALAGEKKHWTPLHLLLSKHRLFENDYYCVQCSNYIESDESYVIRLLNVFLDCPGVNVEARTDEEETALMMAARHGHDYILGKLLDLGADPVAVSQSGKTPAIFAMEQEPSVCLKVLRILFETGLSHEIYKESFAESAILKEVCEKRDTRILDLFHRTGALSDSNRVAMLNAAQAAKVSHEEQEKQAKFVQALTKANPWSLQRCALMYVSARAGLGSPKRRAQALKKILGELMDEGKAAPNQDDCPGNVESRNCRIVLDVPPSDVKQLHLTEEQTDGISKMINRMLIDYGMGLLNNAKSVKS